MTGRLKYLCMCRGTSMPTSRVDPPRVDVDGCGAIVSAAPTRVPPMDEDEVSFPKRAVEAIVELTSTPV